LVQQTTGHFGDDLLVSIIWEEGKSKHTLYLPSGETWINLWNKKEYSGGQYIEVDALVYQTPVFLRKGAELKLPDMNQLYEESVKLTSNKYDLKKLESSEGRKTYTMSCSFAVLRRS
jgi:alpha-glucosidase (family GH31 glycosyl hydrolase)